MSRTPGDISLALCTVAEAEAESLVDRLLAERLIACANLVGPVRSRYRWQGAVEEASETLLVCKTRTSLLPALQNRVRELHSYDCPEVLTFHADGGLPAYLAWVFEETASGGNDGA